MPANVMISEAGLPKTCAPNTVSSPPNSNLQTPFTPSFSATKRPAVRHRQLHCTVGYAFLLKGFFRLAHTGYFGIGIYHAGDGTVAHGILLANDGMYGYFRLAERLYAPARNIPSSHRKHILRGTEVCICPLTKTFPRSVLSKPRFSNPKPFITGRRPTLIRSRSATTEPGPSAVS